VCNEPLDVARRLGFAVTTQLAELSSQLSCGGCLTVVRVAWSDLVPGAAEWPYRKPETIVAGALVRRCLERLERATESDALEAEVAALRADKASHVMLRIPEVFRLAARVFEDVVRLREDAYVLDVSSIGAPGAIAGEEPYLARLPAEIPPSLKLPGALVSLIPGSPFRILREGTLLTRRGATASAFRVEVTTGSRPGTVLASLDLVEPV
jgi:hypothetical protein